MEILLEDIKDIDKKFKSLSSKDWFKIMNTNLNVGIVITRTMDTVLRGMVYDDIATIYFEYEDKMHLFRHPEIKLSDLNYYLNLLLEQNNIWYMEFTQSLMLKNLRINDILIFENGRKGIIILPKENYRAGLYYRLIKKDESQGVKELSLYAGKKYKIERK